MNTHLVRAEIGVEKPHLVVMAGDIHWGSSLCLEDLVKKFVETYRGRDNVSIILMGDEIDAIHRQDRRHNPQTVHPRYRSEPNMIGQMVKDLIKTLEPLKGKIVAGVDSNHNGNYRDATDYDPHEELANALGFKRLGYGGYVIFRCGKRGRTGWTQDVVFAVTHGKHGGGKVGTQINRVADDGMIFRGHVIAHGHTHQLRCPGFHRWFEWDKDKGEVVVGRQAIIQSGCFRYSYAPGHYPDYAEIRRYPPAEPGWACVEIHGDSLFGRLRLKSYVEDYS